MVNARYLDMRLTYERSTGWAGSGSSIEILLPWLNRVTETERRDYLPEDESAAEILRVALPAGGWLVIPGSTEQPAAEEDVN